MRAEVGVQPARRRRAAGGRRSKRKAAARGRRSLFWLVPAAVAGAVLGVGLGFAGTADRIAHGVQVAGVDVGGLTPAQAASVLRRRAAARASVPVVFTANGSRFALRPKRFQLHVDWAGTASRAQSAGNWPLPFRGLKRLELRFFGSDVEPDARAYEAALALELRRIARAVDRPARDAAIVLRGRGPVLIPSVAGVHLDVQRARPTVVRALASFSRQPVELPVALERPQVSTAALAPVLAQARTALARPVTFGYRGAHWRITSERLASFLVLPHGGSRALTIGGAHAQAYFARLARAANRPARDVDFVVSDSGKARLVPSHDGRALDIRASERALLAAAISPTHRTANLVVRGTHPSLTTERARRLGIVGYVGGYTTIYGGDTNRIHNVQLVSRLIDDHLIAPGATFSFNRATGARTASKGFLEAPVIINGELQNGLGGGVCQVSTTVFNAAYEAGLPITARTNHALFISHYPLGRDATVNYPDTDLRFVNDTGRWLLVRTLVGSDALTVRLYGTPAHRRVTTETSPLRSVAPPKKKRIPDPSLYRGTRIVLDYGEPARTVSVRRIVYDRNGKVLDDTTWSSYYQSEPRIIRVGTKPLPTQTTTTTSTTTTTGRTTTTTSTETTPGQD